MMNIQRIGRLVLVLTQQWQRYTLELLCFGVEAHKLAFVKGGNPEDAIGTKAQTAWACVGGIVLCYLQRLGINMTELVSKQLAIPDPAVNRIHVNTIGQLKIWRPPFIHL